MNYFWEIYNAVSTFITTYWEYILIPIISAVIGWGTNVLALKMTFYPLDFIGIRPYFGWQGIIPAKAARMAGMAVDLMTTNLIKIEDQFARLDPKTVSREMKPELDRVAVEIINKVAQAQFPTLWKYATPGMKKRIYSDVAKDLPAVVEEMMVDFKNNITDLFDLRGMVIDTLLEDKTLLNTIFIKCGEKEFKFIENSGFYFGFIFGLLQMWLWFYYTNWWILPVAGLIVGYATNWLALKLIFSPQKPIRIGKFVIQGLFIKRQKEVAVEYAKIISLRILTAENVYDNILYGKASDRLSEIVQFHIQKIVDQVGDNYGNVMEVMSKKRIDVIRNIVAFHFDYDFPIIIRKIYDYTEEALDIENTLRDKMSGLAPEEFQSFLRPVFQEDELKLILVGAFLGFVAGLVQLYAFF